jgi:hypothetical protein
VSGGYAVTVRDAFAVSDVSFAVGGVIVRGAFAVGYAFTMASAIVRGEVAKGGMMARSNTSNFRPN